MDPDTGVRLQVQPIFFFKQNRIEQNGTYLFHLTYWAFFYEMIFEGAAPDSDSGVRLQVKHGY